MEDREGNVGVARVLFKRALQIDSQNVPTWMSWAAMEERIGNAVRADELRNLCLQQVRIHLEIYYHVYNHASFDHKEVIQVDTIVSEFQNGEMLIDNSLLAQHLEWRF